MKSHDGEPVILIFSDGMSSLQNVKGGAVKLNSGYYIPLFGLGTYELTGNEAFNSEQQTLMNILNRCGRL
ncbi:hypothetical protein Y032_0059g2971 [Ancylostoma ceylanicum]|uniref:Uncharacterized protein n=1 Tax=Ancylostoma ceylanicum TaxID=53326 RepID=A0A016U3E1_9BILA|nr:hypothetical protein Y032_0059g2971 [Ancylostoma ceylanicum]